MTLGDLSSADAVRAAAAEFDRVGRDRFLGSHGYGPARTHFLELDGKLYDSKAIVGVAHGYQFPEQGPLHSTDFSGGEATVRRKLEELGFTVRVVSEGDGTPLPDLEVGRSYSWDELAALFGFKPGYLAQTGGMPVVRDPAAVLLITHPGGGRSFDYEDYWDGDDLIYTGKGQMADQKYQGANRYTGENTRPLLVFEGGESKELTYLGRAYCADHWEARGPDKEGNDRRIFRFRLRFDEGGKPATMASPVTGETKQPPKPPERRPRPFDRTLPKPPAPSQQRRTQEETDAEREKASQGHHEILVALADRLEALGWTHIEEIQGAVDLWARNPGTGERVIFEAKTITRENEAHQVRAAIAQLHEYRFLHGEADDHLCLITNDSLDDRRVRFVEHMEIAVIRVDGSSLFPCGPRAQHVVGTILD